MSKHGFLAQIVLVVAVAALPVVNAIGTSEGSQPLSFSASSSFGAYYMFGGGTISHDGKQLSASKQVVLFDHNLLQLLPAPLVLPHPLASMGVGVMDDVIVLIGGTNGRTRSNDALLVNSTTGNITVLSDLLPVPISSPTMVRDSAGLLIIGGFQDCGSDTCASSDIFRLHEQSLELERLPMQLPFPLAAAASLAATDRVYLFGGYRLTPGYHGPSDAILEFIPEINEVRELQVRLPYPLAGATIAELGGRLFLVGGERDIQNDRHALYPEDLLEIHLDPVLVEKSLLKIKQGRLGSTAFASGDKLYIIGGVGCPTPWAACTSIDEYELDGAALIVKREYSPPAQTGESRRLPSVEYLPFIAVSVAAAAFALQRSRL